MCPASSSAEQIVLPMYPAPPVTSISVGSMLPPHELGVCGCVCSTSYASEASVFNAKPYSELPLPPFGKSQDELKHTLALFSAKHGLLSISGKR